MVKKSELLIKIWVIALSTVIFASCSAREREAFKEASEITSFTTATEEQTAALSEGTWATTEITQDTTAATVTEETATTEEQTTSCETTAVTTMATEATTVSTTVTTPETTTASTARQTDERDEIEEINRMNVIGYLTTWNYGCYKTMDWSNLTHVNVAFVNPDANGVFNNDIGNDATLKNIVDTAHENGIKVLASLGGWGGSVNYPALVATDEGMDRLNENLLAFVEKFDLDGIDIDVEGDVDKSFWQYYDRWITELRVLCDENGLLLTTATAKWYAGYISDEALAQFDLVNVMIYDNTGEENHASMEYAVTQLDYFESRGVKKEKLIVGVPFYARNKDFGYMSYKSIIEADESAFDRDFYGEYSYNGKTMIEAKCELARDYGGIMIWELGEDAKEPFSLLDVIGKKLLK